jgi:hypothetical protein
MLPAAPSVEDLAIGLDDGVGFTCLRECLESAVDRREPHGAPLRDEALVELLGGHEGVEIAEGRDHSTPLARRALANSDGFPGRVRGIHPL